MWILDKGMRCSEWGTCGRKEGSGNTDFNGSEFNG